MVVIVESDARDLTTAAHYDEDAADPDPMPGTSDRVRNRGQHSTATRGPHSAATATRGRKPAQAGVTRGQQRYIHVEDEEPPGRESRQSRLKQQEEREEVETMTRSGREPQGQQQQPATGRRGRRPRPEETNADERSGPSRRGVTWAADEGDAGSESGGSVSSRSRSRSKRRAVTPTDDSPHHKKHK